jgi:hypothetical protein
MGDNTNIHEHYIYIGRKGMVTYLWSFPLMELPKTLGFLSLGLQIRITCWAVKCDYAANLG